MFHAPVRALILGLVQLFYPRIEVTGRERLPMGGPVMFVLNHPNGLLDPLTVMVALRRPASFLAKSTFFANPVGKFLMDAFAALPVYRQRDEGKAGGPQGDAAARNERTFARCRALLKRGGAMALCPEGTTHSEPMLLPLRTGAARIALSAEAENDWKLGVQVCAARPVVQRQNAVPFVGATRSGPALRAGRVPRALRARCARRRSTPSPSASTRGSMP